MMFDDPNRDAGPGTGVVKSTWSGMGVINSGASGSARSAGSWAAALPRKKISNGAENHEHDLNISSISNAWSHEVKGFNLPWESSPRAPQIFPLVRQARLCESLIPVYAAAI